MIDLNYKPKKEEPKEELPFIAQIALLLPFAILFWVVLTASFLNGIY